MSWEREDTLLHTIRVSSDISSYTRNTHSKIMMIIIINVYITADLVVL